MSNIQTLERMSDRVRVATYETLFGECARVMLRKRGKDVQLAVFPMEGGDMTDKGFYEAHAMVRGALAMV